MTQRANGVVCSPRGYDTNSLVHEFDDEDTSGDAESFGVLERTVIIAGTERAMQHAQASGVLTHVLVIETPSRATLHTLGSGQIGAPAVAAEFNDAVEDGDEAFAA